MVIFDYWTRWLIEILSLFEEVFSFWEPVKTVPNGGTAQSAESQLFDRMETKRIWSAVIQLPRRFREVVILDAHYGLTAKEIAELLNISQGTVKSRLHRARMKITVILESDNEGE